MHQEDIIYQQIIAIARSYGIFDCIPCARAIKEFLIRQGIHGKHIKLDTNSQDPIYGRIYDASIGELIATTGHHEGVIIEINGVEIVVDNIHHQGITRLDWIQNLYSPILDAGLEFQITETYF
ncbi:MAG: papain fold toxin domain-containing protein [Sphaerospermopsis kisseleviana]